MNYFLKNGKRMLLGAALFSLLYGCSSDTSPAANTKPDAVQEVKEVQKLSPVFNGDSAYYFVKQQVDFGPRNPNSKGHEACARWLEKQLRSFADTLYLQKASLRAFDGTYLNSTNFIATFNPAATKRILLCAHWDTRPFADQDTARRNEPILGANDGGSGVGILLEVARLLKAVKPTVGVDIVLFDSEDYGQPEESNFPKMEDSYCLGSQYWAKNLHRPGYHADFGILLDMCGAKNARFVWEGTSVNYGQSILGKVWGVATEMGYGNYFNYYQKSGIIDDHYYVNPITGIPTIDIIEFDAGSHSGSFSKTWHTHADNMDVIDAATLKAVGQTLLEVVFREK